MNNKVKVLILVLSVLAAASVCKGTGKSADHLFVRQGWTTVEDVKSTVTDISRIKFKPFFQNDGNYASIGGEAAVQRAVEMRCNLGLSDAKYFLERQTEIPMQLRGYYIVFSGTVVRDQDGDRAVAYLDWRNGRWVGRWHWLDSGFNEFSRVACIDD